MFFTKADETRFYHTVESREKTRGSTTPNTDRDIIELDYIIAYLYAVRHTRRYTVLFVLFLELH